MTIIGKDGREMIVLRAASLTDGTIVVINSTTCRERRGGRERDRRGEDGLWKRIKT
jgi:hypothetical protein